MVVSQWYVYPRDMCIPSNMAASDNYVHPPPPSRPQR